MYSIRLASSRVAKELDELPTAVYERVEAALLFLRKDPRPRSAIKLKGSSIGDFRLRVGSYRVVYDIYEEHKEVVILRVARRGSVYR